jgi:outer membrane lipoprotein-sorting protein
MKAATILRLVWVLALCIASTALSCRAAEKETSATPPATEIVVERPPETGSQPTKDTAGNTQDQSDSEEPAAESDVDRVLKLGEKAGQTTEKLDADFEYHLDETLIEEHEWRQGRLVYRKPDKIALEFADGQKESFRFDGRVYVEDRPNQKQRNIHVFRKPNEPTVPILDVDQLPFPHPFGGKRDKLLKNYRITYKGKTALKPWLRPDKKATPDNAGSVKEYEHLELVPKAKSKAAKDYTRVDLWLDPDTGLLRQARTVDKSERILTVRFKNTKTNDDAKKVDEKTFKAGELPPGWRDPVVNDHTKQED